MIKERVELFSDDDEEFSSAEEGSDSEPMLDDDRGNSVRRKSSKGTAWAHNQRSKRAISPVGLGSKTKDPFGRYSRVHPDR